jgi:exosortase E/protease (VPEID-CTERM system)
MVFAECRDTVHWLRPVAFIALLLAEGLYLSFALDSQALSQSRSIWATLIGYSPQVFRLLITIGLVALSLGWRSLWRSVSRVLAQDRRQWAIVSALIAHALSMLVFFWISSELFSGKGFAVVAPGRWALVWLLSGVAALASWAHALVSAAHWWRLAKSHRALAASSAAIGGVGWMFGSVSESFWQPLAGVTFRLAGNVLRFLNFQVISDPDALVLGTTTFAISIAPGCSGYEGVGLITGFLAFYLFTFQRELRFPGALILLPVGMGIMWTLNLLRLVALIAIGDAGWSEIALGGFHSQAGWLTFNVIGLGFVALMHKGRFFAAAPPDSRQGGAHDGTSPFLAPFLALLAVAMMTGAVSAGFDWLYPVRLVVLGAILWFFRHDYAALNWRTSWVGVACGLAAFTLWMALMPDTFQGKADWPHALQSADSTTSALWLVARTTGYVLAVPLAEELAFRGYLTRPFWRSGTEPTPLGHFAWGTFLLSSAIFGAFHGQLWLAGTLAGMLFAVALYRTRSLGDAVLAHATTNALIATYVFVTGRWSVWS